MLAAADILPFGKIQVGEVTNGARLVTYAMRGEGGSGVCRVNGAGAYLIKTGDLVIIATYATMPGALARDWEPKLVLVDAENSRTNQGQ